MRLPADSTAEARASLMRLSALRDHRALPLTCVAPTEAQITLDLPLAWGRQTLLRLEAEDGTVTRIEVAPGAGKERRIQGGDGRTSIRRRVAIPAMPPGRYRAVLEDEPDTPCRLIIAPASCWRSDLLHRRPFGIAAHLYGLRRDGDQGIGDFTTLATFGRLAAEDGAATLGLNPMHALFANDRTRASPYHPSDRRFLDPIYVDVTSGPFARVDGVRAILASHEALFAKLNRAEAVDYPAVWGAKRDVLRAAFDAMERTDGAAFATERADLSAFIADGGDALARFAAFEAISADRRGKPWPDWPQGLRAAEPGAIANFIASHAADVRFAQFQQWLADRAFAGAARETGLGIGFYRDLAVGAAPDGAEAWACQDVLASGVSIGAPPDPFSADGQVWGLPAPDPLGLKRDGYARFAHLLAANMRHAGALRIDHAMGLSRLFWVPDGAGAKDGAYVAYDLAEHLGVLALESRRARCMVIGEDLGTVPEGFRETMDRAGVLSYRVLWLERDGETFRRPQDYPANAAACISTHDLPTLAGWWTASDIDELLALGLATADAALALRRERVSDKAMLAAAMEEAGLSIDAGGTLNTATAARIHQFLARAPSVLKLVQADDLAGDATRINLPGTDRERPNWRRKLKPDIGELLTTPLACAILQALSKN
jgi:4-alpha-glucanotransferase